MKRVVIIGSGLGGLSCGAILAKRGYQVTVLEQHSQWGGCLQCFTRRGARFETGMHFIGSAAPGQTMDGLMRYLEVSDAVKLQPLDADGYEVVSLNGQEYRFAQGREAFVRQMTEYFPHQQRQLNRYFDLVERVAQASRLKNIDAVGSMAPLNSEYMLRSIGDVLADVITDPLLAKVLVGNLPLYAAERGKTPFATHAFIMDFYNQSAFRFVGGSETLADALVKTIERYGGQVVCRQRASRIICDDQKAIGVETSDETLWEADYVVSDAHPMRTLELTDSRLLRPAYRQRINGMAQTVGCFSVYLDFKPGTVPYMNYNYYGYAQDTPWDCELYDEASWPKGYLYMHFCDRPHPAYASTGVVISYMQMSDVLRWQDTTVGHRGADYEAFKRDRAERLLGVLEQSFPGIRGSISHYYTSTPLTYRDYTGTEGGSMYGVAKNVGLGAACRVPHKTRVPNLLQTGQNINSHGMMGVMVGTLVTCSEIK